MPRRVALQPRLLLLAHAALVLLAAAALRCARAAPPNGTAAAGDNWAVLVSSSRYWLNYRHAANALGLYQAIRRLGIPDSRIILMLADQPSCSPRNVHPGRLYLAPGGPEAAGGGGSGVDANLQAADAEVDYVGREVGVEAVLRVLTGRHPPGTPASKRLQSGPASRVLLYLTGHGGDEFLKFHDQEELLAADVASALGQMHAAGRYGELLLLADTCQASTLYGRVTAPNVLAVASSKLGQSSYAHHIDTTIGQHVVDQFTFYLHQFLTTRLPAHPAAGGAPGQAGTAQGVPSMQQLLDFITSQRLSSEVQVRTDLFPRPLARLPVTHFFGGAAAAEGLEDGAAGLGGDGGASAASALRLLAGAQQGAEGEAPASTAVKLHSVSGSRAKLFGLLEAAGSGGGGDAERSSALVTAAAAAAAWVALAVLAGRVLKP